MAPQAEVTVPATRRPRKSTTGVSPKKAVDKENATIDMGTTMAESRKKSRSKSMGPGALDALTSGNGNRRASLAAPARPPPRSILKPTLPLAEIPPHKPRAAMKSAGGSKDAGGTQVALRTEEEQQTAAREREERERATLEKEVNDRREARRKSLANRRVSFAAEATLHTFHEIEYLQDSTTSTDSTRRASSIAARSPAPQVDVPAVPSTTVAQGEDFVPESPADQRELHQKKRRRSSGVTALDFNNEADDTITSTVYDSDSGEDVVVENGDDMLSSGSDSDEGDGTMVTVDGDEMTSASMASARTTSSAESTSGLDEILRLATQTAGSHAKESRRAQVLEDDEEAVPAIIGWGKKAVAPPKVAPPALPQASDDTTAAEESDDGGMDMDMTQAAGGIIRPSQISPSRDQDEDMSIDVTTALGGIISQPGAPSAQGTAQEESFCDEQTMELTMAVGGIQAQGDILEDQRDFEGNEDMSMELTSVMGGVLGAGTTQQLKRQTRQPKAREPDTDDTAMDMTVGVGRILAVSTPGQHDEDGDVTIGMDITTAIGGILPPASPVRAPSEARKAMVREADQPDAAFTTTPSVPRPSPARQGRATPAKAGGDAVDSPDLAAFHGKGLRRTPQSKVVTPGTQKQKSPTRKAAGPSQPATPVKSPRRPLPSPKRQTSPNPKLASKSAPASVGASKVFQQDPSTGSATPLVVLTPQRRRLSGIGIDRTGLGSPKVAQLFDRRESIGESSGGFVLGGQRGNARKVAFEDPRAMEIEVDKERQDEDDKENRRKIMEREADGQDDRDATLNLKEMILGLSPKKNPLKGRKSLHVGSGRGVLGKRPVELDDDDAEDNDGVKRLKGHQGSPVKNVRLQQPPSKAETTGRVTRSRKTLEADVITPSTTSPIKATTPKGQGRFKDVEADLGGRPIDFTTTQTVHEPEIPDDGEERIHLQDFLNMTSIRFMELTTTKRRHTVVPTPKTDSAGADGDVISFEKRVVTALSTVPMLELYQHSCRELKKYISEGRAIVREIETDTFDINPPLFREYMSASPEFRVLMDNQFKNVKTHARLLSKAMWYEWRMELQNSLKEGLLKTKETISGDDALLYKLQELLDSEYPALVEKFEALQQEHDELETAARELAECDPEELQAARGELVALDEEMEAKKRQIAKLRAELEETDSCITSKKESKQRCLEDIQAAEKTREECRGWSSEEISSLKARVDALEKEHGWAVTGCQGTTVSMAYLREIELVFDAAAFQDGQPNGPIDLWYIGATSDNPQPPSVDREYFLQLTRDYLRGLSQAETPPSLMLGAVRAAWDRARTLANQVRLVNLTFPTSINKTSDASIAIRSTILLVPLQTKVEVVFDIRSQGNPAGVEVTVAPNARVVYGEQFNAAKMDEFLVTRTGKRILGRGEQKPVESWGDVLEELKQRLLTRGRK